VLLTIGCPLCRFRGHRSRYRPRPYRPLPEVPEAVSRAGGRRPGCATGTPTAPATAARADVQEPPEAVEVIKSDVAEEPPQPAEAQGKG
jgi:hypothetical protein